MPNLRSNEKITEWCEPKPPRTGERGQHSPLGFWVWIVGTGRVEFGKPGGYWDLRYDFLTDLNACAKFEALLNERGKWQEYMEALLGHLDTEGEPPWWSHFVGIRKTETHRCAALGKVMEEQDG